MNFCSQKLKWRILAIFAFNKTALRTTQLKLHSMYCALFLKTALSATELMYYLWGAIKDKCYADKPEAIDVFMDNIREAIGEIKLYKVDNVLKIGPIV